MLDDARFGAGRLDAARALRGLPGALAPAPGGRGRAAPLRLLASRLGCRPARALARVTGPAAQLRRVRRAVFRVDERVAGRPDRRAPFRRRVAVRRGTRAVVAADLTLARGGRVTLGSVLGPACG